MALEQLLDALDDIGGVDAAEGAEEADPGTLLNRGPTQVFVASPRGCTLGLGRISKHATHPIDCHPTACLCAGLIQSEWERRKIPFTDAGESSGMAM